MKHNEYLYFLDFIILLIKVSKIDLEIFLYKYALIQFETPSIELKKKGLSLALQICIKKCFDIIQMWKRGSQFQLSQKDAHN